jgi:hypothetical protein
MIKRYLGFAIVILMLFALTASAEAQSYYFAVEQETVNVTWNDNGTLSLDYVWVFANTAGAHPIDYVDVGVPNGNFDIGLVSADVDGAPVNVSLSDYQGSGSGFAVVMGAHTIPAGGSGTVHASIQQIENVLYPDDNDSNYASGDFSPTWFGSQYVSGSTNMTVIFHLPPGVQPNEPRYHTPEGGWPGGNQPEAALDSQGRVTYTWRSDQANAYTQYTFGASFPKQYVPDGSIVQPSPFAGLIALLGLSAGTLFNCLCFLGFGSIFFGIPILGVIADRRRKLQYLPPKISIEGHGIKRGLTAVEAAVVMEEPLDKVMTMILFGLIKKGAAEVMTRDPLELRAITDPPPPELREYESEFLKAMLVKDTAARRRDLQDMTVKLVKSVSDKMKGFSRKETVDYYKSINEHAWSQIEAADTPEVKSQKYEEALEWTMLDHDYDNRTRRVFTGPIFVPMWWGRYDPVYRTSTPGTAVPVSTSIPSGRASLPSVPGSTFAASVVTGVQTFSQKVIGNVNDFTSRVTNVTNPPPPPSRSGGGYHSGGCACACACAGCACACAGGGR